MIRHVDGWTNWNFKKSFIPDSLTNFNKEVKCADGAEKWGALCLSTFKCEDIGFEKCSVFGCSLSDDSCKSTLFEMVSSVGLAMLKITSIFINPAFFLGDMAGKIIMGGSKAIKMAAEIYLGM